MARTKKKTADKPKKIKSLSILPSDTLPPSDSEDDALNPGAMWREEVENLLGHKFSSLVEVIDAIAARVCVRLGQESDTNLHDFIVMMLDTDEEIRDELAGLFKIRE